MNIIAPQWVSHATTRILLLHLLLSPIFSSFDRTIFKSCTMSPITIIMYYYLLLPFPSAAFGDLCAHNFFMQFSSTFLIL